MIARHDLVLRLTLSLCLSLSLSSLSHFSSPFTHSPRLFHSPSTSPPHFLLTLNLSTSFFVIYSLSFSIYCLSIAFTLLVCLFSASLLLSSSFSLMYAFFISQFVSLPQPIIIFLYSHILLSLYPSLPLISFSMFLFLSPSTTCVMEGNIASSGPCWTITMQSNPNRDVCRKQHVCNYCLMRPLSQAECPIRLPMRKRCQGPLKKEWERGGKRGREGDGEVEGGCNTERGGEDENMGRGTEERESSKKENRKRKKQWKIRGLERERWRECERGNEEKGNNREREDDFCSKCGVMAELIALSRG